MGDIAARDYILKILKDVDSRWLLGKDFVVEAGNALLALPTFLD